MFIALDGRGERVDIAEAEKGGEYYCPICRAAVIVREGEINAKHFAHLKGQCADTWHYDMSQWHRHMQAYFPADSREVTVTHNGKTHRADVLIANTVIEFQHSPISSAEYTERNSFFAAAGFRVAWVFDVRQQTEEKTIYWPDRDDDCLLAWKNPMRIFSVGDFPSDNNKTFSTWLALNDEDVISKVIWSAKDENGNPSFSRMVISTYGPTFGREVDIDQFFLSKEDYLLREISELKKMHKYSVKYVGKKGERKEAYTCPKRNEFGINLFSEKGCKYCVYCYMTAHKKRQGKNMWAVYCCYPTQVRECCEVHPGYECNAAAEFEL